MSPVLSIVIPAYNRVELLKCTLKSIHQAIGPLEAEVIIVDDGSIEPIENHLQGFLDLPLRFVRQTNQGCVIAKNRGLKEANGQYVTFVDSDDVVHPQKLIAQVTQLERTNADVCYTDEAEGQMDGDLASLTLQPGRSFPEINCPVELYLNAQPGSNNLMFRRNYLLTHLSQPIIPEARILDRSGKCGFITIWRFIQQPSRT